MGENGWLRMEEENDSRATHTTNLNPVRLSEWAIFDKRENTLKLDVHNYHNA